MTNNAPWLENAVNRVATAQLGPVIEDFGRVETIGDGIAMISGLPSVRLDEVLRFQRGQLGFAQTLDTDLIGCVLLDDAEAVEAGDTVRGTGAVIRTPVGPGLLGRVIDPLGRPLDGGPPIDAAAHDPIEAPAPSIIERELVTEPVQTGILTIDGLFALGRGQRELIIGDRSTGKTSIAVDTIINQRFSDLICIYIAVGQKSSSVARVIDAVRTHGAPERCIFVIAAATASPGLQWIAPFAGMTMAEHFRDRGQHALVVIDDLTKHAATHREIALLTRQPPGREAYPGDVFYLHARLLERAAKLSREKGSGSLTALPIAETDAGNLSAYIPTNLISITDGQLVLTRGCSRKVRSRRLISASVSAGSGGRRRRPRCGRLPAPCDWTMRSSWNWKCFHASAAFPTRVSRHSWHAARDCAPCSPSRNMHRCGWLTKWRWLWLCATTCWIPWRPTGLLPCEPRCQPGWTSMRGRRSAR